MDRPTVAAVNSHAIAGGTLIASACDYRLACSSNATKSKCGLNEVLNGFYIPYRMQKICGFAFSAKGAYKQFLDGNLISLKQAAQPEYMWIDRIVDTSNVSNPSQLYSKENYLSSPLVTAAIERVRLNPKSFKAYAYTKAIQQEELRALVLSKPNATKNALDLLQQQIKLEAKRALESNGANGKSNL